MTDCICHPDAPAHNDNCPQAPLPQPGGLPPLAISTARCRKCGNGTRIGVEWQPSSAQLVAGEIIDARTHGDDGEPGWMLRTCHQCGYKWAEAVL